MAMNETVLTEEQAALIKAQHEWNATPSLVEENAKEASEEWAAMLVYAYIALVTEAQELPVAVSDITARFEASGDATPKQVRDAIKRLVAVEVLEATNNEVIQWHERDYDDVAGLLATARMEAVQP